MVFTCSAAAIACPPPSRREEFVTTEMPDGDKVGQSMAAAGIANVWLLRAQHQHADPQSRWASGFDDLDLEHCYQVLAQASGDLDLTRHWCAEAEALSSSDDSPADLARERAQRKKEREREQRESERERVQRDQRERERERAQRESERERERENHTHSTQKHSYLSHGGSAPLETPRPHHLLRRASSSWLLRRFLGFRVKTHTHTHTHTRTYARTRINHTSQRLASPRSASHRNHTHARSPQRVGDLGVRPPRKARPTRTRKTR